MGHLNDTTSGPANHGGGDPSLLRVQEMHHDPYAQENEMRPSAQAFEAARPVRTKEEVVEEQNYEAVAEMLRSIGCHKAVPIFRYEQMDMRAFVLAKREDLIEIGVDDPHHVQAMLNLIDLLKAAWSAVLFDRRLPPRCSRHRQHSSTAHSPDQLNHSLFLLLFIFVFLFLYFLFCYRVSADV